MRMEGPIFKILSLLELSPGSNSTDQSALDWLSAWSSQRGIAPCWYLEAQTTTSHLKVLLVISENSDRPSSCICPDIPCWAPPRETPFWRRLDSDGRRACE